MGSTAAPGGGGRGPRAPAAFPGSTCGRSPAHAGGAAGARGGGGRDQGEPVTFPALICESSPAGGGAAGQTGHAVSGKSTVGQGPCPAPSPVCLRSTVPRHRGGQLDPGAEAELAQAVRDVGLHSAG